MKIVVFLVGAQLSICVVLVYTIFILHKEARRFTFHTKRVLNLASRGLAFQASVMELWLQLKIIAETFQPPPPVKPKKSKPAPIPEEVN